MMMFEQKEAGLDMATRPDIDLIVLEATGLADPADMLDELTDPFLWQRIEVGGILSVIDSWRITGLYDTLEWKGSFLSDLGLRHGYSPRLIRSTRYGRSISFPGCVSHAHVKKDT